MLGNARMLCKDLRHNRGLVDRKNKHLQGDVLLKRATEHEINQLLSQVQFFGALQNTD